MNKMFCMTCGFKIEFIHKPNFCPSCGSATSAVAAKKVAPPVVKKIEDDYDDEDEDSNEYEESDVDFDNVKPFEFSIEGGAPQPVTFGQIAKGKKSNIEDEIPRANARITKKKIKQSVIDLRSKVGTLNKVEI